MVLSGILYHAWGRMAAGRFYLPLKRVRAWAWESGWLVNGVFSWIPAPRAVAWLTVPRYPCMATIALLYPFNRLHC